MSVHFDSLPAEARANNPEQDEWRTRCPEASLIETRAHDQVQHLLTFVNGASERSFHEVEARLVPLLFGLGRLLLALFLCRRHEESTLFPAEVRAGQCYQRRQPQSREVGTVFGKVRYWRTYMYRPGGGYYPLDQAQGLPADGFSLTLSSLMTRLATKMSYAQVTTLLHCFLHWSPSQTVVERAVLGLGRHTAAWFEQAPPPEEDGEVLIIQIDSKATPTATESELAKRRGRRAPRAVCDSPRHRGREQRQKNPRKRRRKKGEKAKNGRAATVVVLYTLRHGRDAAGEPVLKGPLNQWTYASYAPKRHAFAIGRREATKRGFTPESGKTIQLVTDGDPDLARYAAEYFPEALHTLDIYHAKGYLWEAGLAVFREGSEELDTWVEAQKEKLYQGQLPELLAELRHRLAALPKTGPGSKGKRKRLNTALGYLESRQQMMPYAQLIAADLEIGSGAVEGAVRYIVAQRFDCAGMRWIKERAEPLLQLRCIERNGHWDAFIAFVQATTTGASDAPLRGSPLQASLPGPLPTLGITV